MKINVCDVCFFIHKKLSKAFGSQKVKSRFGTDTIEYCESCNANKPKTVEEFESLKKEIFEASLKS